jgi:4-amino-4-deoxy-L-arabinose transferase-like glycosyltransferase
VGAPLDSLSAFFPCYNDAPTIEGLVRRVIATLEPLVSDYEVVVVDDGSADESPEILRRLERELPQLRVVTHEVNGGYGAALRSGFAACTKDWIFYTDGDGQYDPAEVRRLIRLVTPEVDLAQGWKLKRGDGRLRAVIGRAYHHLVARLFGLPVRDTDCDFRLFRRWLAEQADLQSDSGAICVEMMYRFAEEGARCVQTPVHHYARPYGRSEFFRLPHLLRTFRELGRLWLRLRVERRPAPRSSLPAGTTRVGWSRRATVLGLGAVMAVALGVHVWGLSRDLPMPDVDERYFVPPAAYVAASGDLDPHWFGHPGSTVIYPLAAIFRAREVLFHGAPLTGAAPSIARRLRTDPGTFYLLGRIWAMLFSIAAIPLIFVIGRKVFSDLTGFLAAAMWAVVPLAVQYGQITRTDSVALFLALAAFVCLLRTLERPTARWLIAAGAIAGLAVSTRYFLAVLVVPIAVTWLAARRHAAPEGESRRLAVGALAGALGAAAVSFALTTPYFFLDWHTASASLSTEASARIPAQHHSLFANLGFYLLDTVPHAISWIGIAALVVGVGAALLHRTPARTLLLLWVPCVLVSVSVMPAHWSRWLIPALPIVVLFAMFGVTVVGSAIGGWTRQGARRRARPAFVMATIAVFALVAIGPAEALVRLDRSESEPSTRTEAAAWLEHHLPPASRIAVEIKGPDLTGTTFHSVHHYALPLAGTIEDYARAGYRYLVVNDGMAHRYRTEAAQHPHAVAFYDYLRDDATRLQRFRPDRAHAGPHLAIYDLGPTVPAAGNDVGVDATLDAVTLRTTARSYVRRGGEPVPFDRRVLRQLAREATGAGSSRVAEAPSGV